MNKRKLLEDKLQKRKDQASLKREKASSKILQELRDEQLKLFTEEAFRLSETVETLESNHDDGADSLSQESLVG